MLFDRLRLLDAQVQQAADMQVSSQRAHTRLLARMGFSASIAVCAILALWTVAFAVMARRSKMYRLAALRDSLTGVQNRRGAIAALDAQVSAAHPASFGLVFVDLDGFKKINDVYGHATGDALLRGVASRLQSELRAGDAVCRLGGDEFVCIVAPPASSEEVSSVARRLCRAVTRPYEIEGDAYVIGCSVGTCMYPKHGKTAEALLARADRAMYEAKAAGGGVREAAAR
jgi:diguanylate cyclase (GGDEF)-like protein